MIYIKKSKFNEMNILEELRKYLSCSFDEIIPIHRRPGYHLQHHYRLESNQQQMNQALCRVTFMGTQKWGRSRMHVFKVEITSNGRCWTNI